MNLPSDAEVIGRSLAEPRPSGSSTIATPPPCSASWAARRVGAEVAEGLVGELFRIAFERRKTFDASRVSALPWMFEVPEAFRSLRSRDFRAFLGVQTISQIGTYMLSVAEAWLVVPRQNRVRLTRRAAELGQARSRGSGRGQAACVFVH